jgi:hypothetical protein
LLKEKIVRALTFERPGKHAGEKRWTFTQPQMFMVRRGSLSSSETIMTNADLDKFITPNPEFAGLEIWKATYNEALAWRSRQYAFYKKGFETQLDLPFGDTITYLERMPNGKTLSSTLDFGKWKNAEVEFYSLDGKPTRAPLNKAYGIGIVDIEKLDLAEVEMKAIAEKQKVVNEKVINTYDENTLYCTVTFKDEFNPQRDLAIIDIMRPRNNWGHLGAMGFPVRLPIAGVSEYRYSQIFHATELGDSTGYHGSVVRTIWTGEGYDYRSVVTLNFPWFWQAGVAAIDLGPSITEKLNKLMKKADSLGDPEQLLRVAADAETMITELGASLRPVQQKIRELKELATGLRRIVELPPLVQEVQKPPPLAQ